MRGGAGGGGHASSNQCQCGCVFVEGGSSTESEACVFKHEAGVRTGDAKKGATTGGVCSGCTGLGVCPNDGCLCYDQDGHVMRTHCKLHTALTGVVFASGGMVQGCGACVLSCFRCGCKVGANSKCRARKPNVKGQGVNGPEHAVCTKMMRIRTDGHAECEHCVVDPVCIECRRTSTHTRFCADGDEAEYRADGGDVGAGGGGGAGGGSVFGGKAGFPSLTCKVCNSKTAKTTRDGRDGVKSARFDNWSRQRMFDGIGVEEEGRGDKEGSGEEDFIGGQNDGNVNMMNKPKLQWRDLRLLKWGGVLHHHIAEKGAPQRSSSFDESDTFVGRALQAAQVGICLADAHNTGRFSVDELVVDMEAFLATRRVTEASRLKEKKKMKRWEGVPMAVKEMCAEIKKIVGKRQGAAAGVGLGRAGNTSEMKIVKSLAVQFRDKELGWFSRRG